MKEKKDKKPEDSQSNELREPAVEYGFREETEMMFSPPLTEEELKDSITGDELREYMRQHIHELFTKK